MADGGDKEQQTGSGQSDRPAAEQQQQHAGDAGADAANGGGADGEASTSAAAGGLPNALALLDRLALRESGGGGRTQKAVKGKYAFWETQPVSQFTDEDEAVRGEARRFRGVGPGCTYVRTCGGGA